MRAIHQPLNSQGNYNFNTVTYREIEFPTHFHKNYEVAFVAQGTLTVTLDGREFSLAAGEWVWVLSNQIHAYRGGEGSLVRVTVFSEDHVPRFAAAVADRQAADPVFRCPPPVQQMVEACLYGEEASVMLRKACFYALGDCLLAHTALVPRETAAGVMRVMEYVAQHFAEPLTLQELSAQCGYEYHYLSRLLNRTLHMGFRALLDQYRVERARELLVESDRPVAEIAAACGFSGVRSFHYVFRALTGHSPRQERELLRGMR